MLLLEKSPLGVPARSSKSIKNLLGGRKLIIASNRGPVEHYVKDGELKAKRGGGGVVTALSAVAEHAEVVWIASAMTDGDRLVADGLTPTVPGAPDGVCLGTRFVTVPDHVYHNYYNVFSNPVLWFVQHQMTDRLGRSISAAELQSAWTEGYEAANRAFADAVVREIVRAAGRSIVMLHDYHLYRVAKHVRQQAPGAVLQHFVHIPWPAPGHWQYLPPAYRARILEGLCANDVVGFQTNRSLKNFLMSCQAFLPESKVDFIRGEIVYRGHTVKGRVYPISIDNAQVRRIAESPLAALYLERLRPLCGEHTIVRVDRVDPSKNIVRGFQAFDLLLARNSELVGRVKFLCFLVPSRGEICEYRDYAQEVLSLAAAINAKYGTDRWRPIELFYENNYEQALAGLQLYDVLLVNPIQDGMNLVAKEGALLNRKAGVIVLSDQAGAHEQLRGGVLSVDPLDVEGTAEAIRTALTMPFGARRERAAFLRNVVESYDITSWLRSQIEDLSPYFTPRPLAVGSGSSYATVVGSQTAPFGVPLAPRQGRI